VLLRLGSLLHIDRLIHLAETALRGPVARMPTRPRLNSRSWASIASSGHERNVNLVKREGVQNVQTAAVAGPRRVDPRDRLPRGVAAKLRDPVDRATRTEARWPPMSWWIGLMVGSADGVSGRSSRLAIRDRRGRPADGWLSSSAGVRGTAGRTRPWISDPVALYCTWTLIVRLAPGS
jgi:hypothetical protein